MAVNKEGNSYTFIFSIAMVVIVGTILSSLSIGLKPYQDENKRIKKQMDILAAIGVESNRENASTLYQDHIVNSYVISAQGNILEKEVAFDINIQKQIRDKTIAPEDRLYPIYEASIEGKKKYVLPVVGKGLWGPIWGYVAIKEDMESIDGVSFDHKSETPGLGAEINQDDFQRKYIDAKISVDGRFAEVKVVKDGTGESDPQKVDGITGGTITSKGVEEMMNRTLRVYQSYFSSKK